MFVSPKRYDLINSVETIKLAHAFFSGRELVNMYKQKNPGKKVVSVTLPYSEIIVAMDAIPLNLLRYEEFTYKNTHALLRNMTNLTKTFGWTAMDNLMKVAYFTRAGADIVDIIVENLIGALTERNAYVTKQAEQHGFPVDSCFGSRMLYGINLTVGKIADACFDVVYRCPFFYKYYDSLTPFMKNNYILDVPVDNGDTAEKTLESDLMEFISMMEKLTGNRFSEERLAEALNITNELKALYKEILFVIAKNNVIPYNPLTFSNVQAVMMYSFIDFNSNLKAYKTNLKNLYAEMLKKVESGNGFDASKTPKVLYTPMFTGLEEENVKILSRLGARVILADWEIFGYLEPVNTSNNVLRNFVRHMLKMGQFLGPNSETLASTMIRVAKDLNADGVLFQSSFACKNIAPVLKIFKEKARLSGIPVVETSFNNMGENIEQNKTRLEAFMEMIKE